MNSSTGTSSHDLFLAGQAVSIRMYNVGFGDCFLVSIPSAGRPRRILFDCGTISSTRPISDVAAQVLRDSSDSGVPTIDVVVCTHRHRDHVSGFDDPIWKAVKVTEVWMPWTEDPKDAQARRIRERQSKIAAALHRSVETRLATAPNDDRLLGMRALAANALTNHGAMLTLHEGFTGRATRRFLPTPSKSENTFETPALPGVIIHVLGPSRDKEVIRDMDPPVGQSYLRLQGGSEGAEFMKPDAFNESWWVEESDFSQEYSALNICQADRERIRELSAQVEFAVAVSLDKAVNGTSLMLALQIGTAYLLFPGDAQWGTWHNALACPESRELLGRTRFYKIGHHASHNATPIEFVENVVGKDFWAMASTHNVKQWPNIPRQPLLDAIMRRTEKLARSDRPSEANPPFVVNGEDYVEAFVPI